MNNYSILLVDDDNAYRDELASQLRENYSRVEVAGTGEMAIDMVKENPKKFQFAVIDHKLGSGLDGIATTKELVKINPGLYPVVFTNLADNDMLKYKYEALKAGAYRYLEWSKKRDKDIKDFVKEINQLEQLSQWIKTYYDARTEAPSLMTQLDIGMDIIDHHYKLWFMNERMRKIIGISGTCLPRAFCADWHELKVVPCPGCLVKECFDGKTPEPKIFLSHLRDRTDHSLIYLKVWAQPLRDKDKNIIYRPALPGEKTSNRKPLAIIESVRELTNTNELKNMPLDNRLKIICNALFNMNKEEYSYERLFQYVRIYYLEDHNTTDSYILKATIGKPKPSQLNISTDNLLNSLNYLDKAKQNMKATGFGFYVSSPTDYDPAVPGEKRIPYIYCPIIENEKIIAVLEAGGNNTDEDVVKNLIPYTHEIVHAIYDFRNNSNTIKDVYKSVADIDLLLQREPRSADEQLKLIIQRACKLTNSHQYILRYREGDNAKLLELDIPQYHTYERVADNLHSLSSTNSWSCRAISSGVETLANTYQHSKTILSFRKELNSIQKKVLEDVHAICYEPLIFEGRRIGSIGFHAKKVNNYNEENLAILRALVKWITFSLRDYLTAKEIREKTEAESKAHIEVLGLVLHNIKTPLETAQINLYRFTERVKAKMSIEPEMQELADTVTESLSEINKVNQAVLKLKKPWESRIENVDVEGLLNRISETIFKDHSDIEYRTENATPIIEEIKADQAALKVSIEVMLENTIDAFKSYAGKNKTVIIKMRNITDKEKNIILVDSSFNYFAIDVIDNGSGIPKKIKQSLFKKMQSDKPDGIGIGLVYCHSIIQASHGKLYYEETHKPGAKFTLILPYKEK